MAIARMTGLASAALLALATTAAAAADIPGNASTKAVLKTGAKGVQGTFEKKGDSDWYRVTLKGGQNYAVFADATDDDGAMTVNLRDAKGKVLDTAKTNGGANDGFEFMPAKDGIYFVEFKATSDRSGEYPATYDGNVAADARGDTATDAVLQLGQTLTPVFNWGSDTDNFRTVLKGGTSYSLTVNDGTNNVYVRLLDAKGKSLLGLDTGNGQTAQFKVAKSGTYFVQATLSEDYAANDAYTIKLTSP